MSNIWRSLDLSLINFEMKLDLQWSKNCIIFEIFSTPEIDANPAAVPAIEYALAISTTSTLFQINSTKFYVPVVTSFINNNIRFLKNLKQGFKRKIS